MSTRDQLEIIGPGGEIRFYDLNPVKGFANIGSHPDNDIVIASPDVAPFHAVLDHRQKPLQLIVLGRGGPTRVGGQVLEANSSRALNPWDTIELDGHTIVIVDGVSGDVQPMAAYAAPAPAYVPPPEPAPAGGPTPAAGAAPEAAPLPMSAALPALPAGPAGLGAPVPDQIDDYILVEASARDFTLDVDQTATFDLTIANGSPLVATFEARIDGLDPLWVVAPAPVNLFENEKRTVSFSITPPRAPASRAGNYYFAVIVTSPENPGRLTRLGFTLTVNPYFDHSVTEVSPRTQRLHWFKRSGKVSYAVSNKGNSEAAFRLDAVDDERLMQFEFKLDPKAASLAKQAELRLAPEETRSIEVSFNLLKRIFFGFANQLHSFTVTTTPLQGLTSPRSLLAQVDNAPLIGPIHVILLAVALAVLIAIVFRPAIHDFSADPETIISGEEVTLRWDVSPFADVKLDQDLGSQGRGDGSVVIMPLDNTAYRLTVSTPLLGSLLPFLFTRTEEQAVIVDPLFPIVRVEITPDRIVQGESATLSWEIYNADEAVLIINGALESIEPAQFIGSRAVSPDGQATFEIRASNRYDTRSDTAVLNAIAPTETPVPRPVINRFDAVPGAIIAGEEVTLEWNVTGAEKVRIDPGGQEFPPVGKVILKPDQTTPYTLTAINGTAESSSFREVIVNPAPTPTPVPGTPIIDFFTATPLEVARGSDQAANIQLAWSVSGDMTDIVLSGETLGTISGLDRQGTRTVSAGAADTRFVLTAFNGELDASQTITIKVVVPVPIISSLNPASTTNVGGSGFTLTVNGANFVDGATVRWDDSDRPTTFVSTTQLLASIGATDIAEAGTAKITVFNPADSGGGASSAANFIINNPLPSLSGIDPQHTVVDSPDVTLVVSGSSFIADSVVRWNGTDLDTTFNNSNTLTAVVPTDKFSAAGTASVTVFNPKPGGGTSGSQTFTINNALPTLTSLGPPSYALYGSDAMTLLINGTGFVGGSNGTRVSWGDTIRTPTFISSEQLSMLIPAEDLLVPGPIEVGVFNGPPGGGSSNSLFFDVRRTPVNIVVSASPGSAVSGQTIIFTAIVTPVNSAITSPVPSGSVTFKINGNPVGSPPLSASSPATASVANIRLAAGTYSITAEYSGDTNFDVKTSLPFSYTVNKANVSITLGSNSNPRALGESVTFTANVNPTAPGSSDPVMPSGGTVQFLRNGSPIGLPVTVSAGSASYTTTASELGGGNNTITAQYNGDDDPNFNSGSTTVPLIQQMTEAVPKVAFATSPTTSTYGGAATFKVIVSSPVSFLTPSTGATVTFKSGATVLGTAVTIPAGANDCTPIDNPDPCVVASYTTSTTTFNAGLYSITAEFDGNSDPNFTSATSSVNSHTVNEAPTTASVSYTSPNASTYGNNVTYFGTVSGGAAGTPSTGTISFYASGQGFICSGTVSAGSASCTNNQIWGGVRNVTARYDGQDPNFLSSPDSPNYQHTTNQRSLTTANFNFSGTSGAVNTAGGSVTGSWTVSVNNPSGLAAITGNITFYYSSSFSSGSCAPLNTYQSTPTIPLVNGSATKTESITQSEGYFQIYASYGGDQNYAALNPATIILIGFDTPCS